MFREKFLEAGELFRIRFEYLKLQNHCKLCFRMTHDSRNCPDRVGLNRNHRERQREPIRNHEEDGEHRGRIAPREVIAQPIQTRE